MFGTEFWKNLAEGAVSGGSSGLLGQGLNFLGGLQNEFFDKRAIQRQVEASKELTDYSFEKQIEFWNAQNAYNDPSSQVARLRKAGLNPAMLNGNSINNTAGNLSSVPQAAAPHGSSHQGTGAPQMAMLAQVAQSMAQTGFIEEDTRLLTQKILSEILEQDVKEIAKMLGLEDYEIRRIDKEALFEAYYGTGIDGGAKRIKDNPLTVQIEEARQRIKESQASEAYTQSLTETADTLRPLLAEAEKANTALSKARVANTIAETTLIPFMQRELESKINLNDANALKTARDREKVEEEILQLLDSREFNLMIKEAGANEAKAKAATEAAKSHVRQITSQNLSGGVDFAEFIGSLVDAYIWNLVN